jgi:hypothetical protein
MSEQQDEQDRQMIGRYQVFIYGHDVMMFHTCLDSMRILTPAEALMFLEWLHQHREDLYKTLEEEEGKQALK